MSPRDGSALRRCDAVDVVLSHGIRAVQDNLWGKAGKAQELVLKLPKSPSLPSRVTEGWGAAVLGKTLHEKKFPHHIGMTVSLLQCLLSECLGILIFETEKKKEKKNYIDNLTPNYVISCKIWVFELA